MPALPRSASASSVPIFSSRLSISVSTRETKKLATEAMPARVCPFAAACSRPVQVGAHDVAVALDREDQRDVDADALGRARWVIAGRPSSVAGILTSRLGRSTAFHRSSGLGEGGVGVAGEPRVDLERHPAVDAAGGLPGAAEHVAGLLDVGDGDLADGVVDRRAAGGQLADLLVVGLAVRQRRREDRRVGGDPDDALVGDQLLQVAAGAAARATGRRARWTRPPRPARRASRWGP